MTSRTVSATPGVAGDAQGGPEVPGPVRQPWPSRCVAGGVVAWLASCVHVGTGGGPGPLVVVAVAVATLALRCWLPTALALATVLSAALGAVAVVMPVLPLVGVDVSTLVVAPAVVGAVGLVVLWRRRATAFAVAPPDLAVGAGLAAVSLAEVVAVPVVRSLTGSPKVAWFMRGDAPWNVVSSRFVIEDGGLDPDVHRNPAPLANEVVAAFSAPGRSGLAPDELLAHDLQRVSAVMLLLTAGVGLLAGLAVAGAVPAWRPWSRAVLALVATTVPWTWYFAGQAFLYGFWNSLPAAVLLLSAWTAWLSAPRHPVASSWLLGTVGVGLLAAWAPLVLAPAAFGLVVVAWHRRPHLALRGWALVGWSAPLVALLAYAGLVTWPDYVASSRALALEGPFPPFGENLPVVFWLVPLCVLLLLSAWSVAREDLVGVVVLGLVGAIGTFHLMQQRVGTQGGPWGYYPQKFGWSLSLLAPLVVLASLRSPLAAEGLRRAQRARLVLAAVLLCGALLLQVPPNDPRPVTASYPVPHRTPDYRLSSLLPVVSIALPDRSSAFDPAVEDLLALQEPGAKVVASRWSRDPGVNTFINYWLLQLPARSVDDQPGEHAYSLDSFDPAALCELVRDWGPGVVIRTRSPILDEEMRAVCPRQSYVVRLG